MNKTWIAALAAGLLSLAAAAQQSSTMVLADAWVRALPPTQTNTAAYVTVTNPGKVAIMITGASTGLAQQVQIHTTREIEGYMRMEQLQNLPVAPGESVQLAPGGTHLMLLGLSRMPMPGETVHFCLELATGEEVCTDAPVRKSAAAQKADDHHQHH